MTTMHHQETLDAAMWFDRLGRFVERLGESGGGVDRHIRRAYHLQCLAPHALKPLLAEPIEETRLEAMLDCGAFESAITRLVGTAGQVTVKASEQDAAIEVRTRIAPRPHDGNAASDTWSVAMLEAWAVSFLRYRQLPH